MSQVTITLLFLLFAIVMFMWEKIPLGLTSMIVCVGLVVTGVLDWKTAFSGFIDTKMSITFYHFGGQHNSAYSILYILTKILLSYCTKYTFRMVYCIQYTNICIFQCTYYRLFFKAAYRNQPFFEVYSEIFCK